jgi:hypothetical protein
MQSVVAVGVAQLSSLFSCGGNGYYKYWEVEKRLGMLGQHIVFAQEHGLNNWNEI